MDYNIRLSCCNCYSVATYTIERGVPHNEAVLECANCGCSPVARDYTVIAAGGEARHTLKKRKVD